ncbi:hypothetical protein [Sphaerotilus microaerophilus]|uniref:Uncharacterized protein n=1 Tax=Sphaerotilus microaerophilus TaxID=2914710 RepID=A0ABM7YRM0_9BURK|nr:hypothetical protein [Sphaerotilus sp. FB-5]BDI07226.1 hypothetical protein CATMQ487_41960 [Sphaerotilus sp. FB-5]
MLSDACFDFTDAVFTSGVSDELYDQLLRDLESYRAEVYPYPATLLSFLKDLVLEVRDGTAPNVKLMMALGETLRAYDSNRDDLIESLEARLAEMWPHRVHTSTEASAEGPHVPGATVHCIFGADRGSE